MWQPCLGQGFGLGFGRCRNCVCVCLQAYRRAVRRPLPAERNYLAAQYVGVGIQFGELSRSTGGRLVVGPLGGSPAEAAGDWGEIWFMVGGCSCCPSQHSSPTVWGSCGWQCKPRVRRRSVQQDGRLHLQCLCSQGSSCTSYLCDYTWLATSDTFRHGDWDVSYALWNPVADVQVCARAIVCWRSTVYLQRASHWMRQSHC